MTVLRFATPATHHEKSHGSQRIVWSATADAHLIRMRREGASLRSLASAFRIGRQAVADRAAVLGMHTPTKLADRPRVQSRELEQKVDAGRDPLHAGHPTSWNLINEGTCLEGAAYTAPSNDRLGRTQWGRG